MISIVVAIISAVATVAAVIVTNSRSNTEIQHKIETQQAVFETKLDGLTADVKEQSKRIDQHNHLNERLIAVEIKLDALEAKK